ncbi:hypothetical protein [Actinoplanes sp. NPDC049599]|uniref:hypothetical protein n=1 Tax=Actinoplanes sp. NPDC049599 TaxID=3363903 RepID=UPI003792CA32
MSPPTVRAASLVVLALVLAGCSSTEQPAAGSAATATAVTSAPAASSPAPSRSVAPSARPCQRTTAWSQTQTLNWVRAMSETDSSSNVVLGGNDDVDDLCKGLAVQVEFWRVDLTSFVGNASFELKSVLRKQVTIDGRRTVTIKPPKNFSARECTGILTAVYVGKPLTEAELPTELDPAGMAGKAVEFDTDRVAYSVAGMPGSTDDLRSCHPPL